LTGLVVIGPTAEAVARAIDPDAWVLEAGAGTPAIAAAHAGREHRPGELADAARAADVVALDTHVLAPLTARYAARDLALELGAPVVVAVEARDGLTGPARAAAEAVRAGGLPVAAIVLTGWPDPPSRVLLDERVMLHETSGVPVLTLGAAERPDWPVDEWREAAPVPGVGAAAGVRPQRVALEPYRAWEGEAPGDPRSAPRPRIMETLLEIVGVEGPMLASRAYALFNRAAGGKKLTSVARAPLSNSVYHLAREGKLALRRAEEVPWQGDDLVALPDAPPVVVRELGPRELIEVPLDEVAELMRRLRNAGHAGDLKRAVLDTYGLVRMTARAEQYLTSAQELLES
jgi:hypothetical protein